MKAIKDAVGCHLIFAVLCVCGCSAPFRYSATADGTRDASAGDDDRFASDAIHEGGPVLDDVAADAPAKGADGRVGASDASPDVALHPDATLHPDAAPPPPAALDTPTAALGTSRAPTSERQFRSTGAPARPSCRPARVGSGCRPRAVPPESAADRAGRGPRARARRARQRASLGTITSDASARGSSRA